MNKKKVLTLVFSTAVLVAGVTAASKGNFLHQTAEECEHVGYHYAGQELNYTEDGRQEFWTCCECKETFTQEVAGTWEDRDIKDAVGGIPNEVATKMVLAKSASADSVEYVDAEEMAAPEGFQFVSKTTGDGKTGHNFAGVNLDGYKSIKFMVRADGSHWFELFKMGQASGAFLQTDKAEWHTIILKDEGNNKFQLYIDGTDSAHWKNMSIPKGNPANMFLCDYFGIKLGTAGTFYFTEIIGEKATTEKSRVVVSDLVLSGAAFNAETLTSTIGTTYHVKKNFVSLNAEPYEELFFYVYSTEKQYFDVCDTSMTVADYGHAKNNYFLVRLIKNADKWDVYCNSSYIRNNLAFTNGCLGDACFTSNVSTTYTFSQLFGYLGSQTEVVAEAAIQGATQNENGVYAITPGGHYSMKAFASVDMSTYSLLTVNMRPTAKDGYIALQIGETLVKDKAMNKVQWWSYNFINNLDGTWDIYFDGNNKLMFDNVAIPDNNLANVKWGTNSTICKVPTELSPLYGVLRPTTMVLSQVVANSVMDGEAGSSNKFTAYDSRMTTAYKWGSANPDVLSEFDMTSYSYLYFYIYCNNTFNIATSTPYSNDNYAYGLSTANNLAKLTFARSDAGWRISINGNLKTVIKSESLTQMVSFRDWSNGNSYFSEMYGF